MKFFLLSLSFLVCSITIPKYSIAQKVFPTLNNKGRAQIFAQNSDPGSLTSPEPVRLSSQNKGKSVPAKMDAKVLRQMEHELLISEQFLELFADPEADNLISLEASLVDLKGQCRASFDRLRDFEDDFLPKECMGFYQLLLHKFVPKAEALLDARWSGKTTLLEGDFDQDFQQLRNCLDRIVGHLAQL